MITETLLTILYWFIYAPFALLPDTWSTGSGFQSALNTFLHDIML